MKKFDWQVGLYGLTIFISAFLLFLVQPLISKYILPWYGGTATVWTICVLFFQIALLFGYLYAHLSSHYLQPKKQIILHLILLVLAIIVLPILPAKSWQPGANDEPITQIILMLTVCLGLPIFVLSSSSPLLSAWFSQKKTKHSPYPLYALSNAGSFLALFSFPFLLEPFWTIKIQSSIWTVLFIGFAVLCGVCALALWKTKQTADLKSEEVKTNKPTVKIKLIWLGLSACTVILLLGVTSKITQDISVVSLFWTLPLAVYLLSYILTFKNSNSKSNFNNLYIALGVIIFLGYYFNLILKDFVGLLLMYLGILFIFCLVCHNELYRLRPEKKYLTSFYLMNALGGVLGGIFCGLIAPIIFNSFMELTIVLIICLIISFYIFLREEKYSWSSIYGKYNKYFNPKKPLFIVLLLLIIHLLYIEKSNFYKYIFNKFFINGENIEASRNFYGLYKVKAYGLKNTAPAKILVSGTTIHGQQFSDPITSQWPTSYFAPKTGLGLLMTNYFSNREFKMGGIGLGIGTIAAYGKVGDYIKFYEIDKEVLRLAKKHFTYLSNSKAQIDVVIGDARLSLEKEEPQNFDILVIDAFASDSIPIHLLTKEAMEIYLKNIKPDGIIAAHISNRHLDLKPVIVKLAQYYQLNYAIIENESEPETLTARSTWILLSKSNDIISGLKLYDNYHNYEENMGNFRLWTDDYSNILAVIR